MGKRSDMIMEQRKSERGEKIKEEWVEVGKDGDEDRQTGEDEEEGMR